MKTDSHTRGINKIEMAKIYCNYCKDYRDYFSNGDCEGCAKKHDAHNYSEPTDTYQNNDFEPAGLPHDSDCFWID